MTLIGGHNEHDTDEAQKNLERRDWKTRLWPCIVRSARRVQGRKRHLLGASQGGEGGTHKSRRAVTTRPLF